jgi:hypothetical protein
MYILCYMIGVPPFGAISLRNSFNSTYGTPPCSASVYCGSCGAVTPCLKPCTCPPVLHGASFQLITFDYQSNIIHKRYGLEHRVSILQPLKHSADG